MSWIWFALQLMTDRVWAHHGSSVSASRDGRVTQAWDHEHEADGSGQEGGLHVESSLRQRAKEAGPCSALPGTTGPISQHHAVLLFRCYLLNLTG